MCGIAGFFEFGGMGPTEAAETLSRMCDAIAHRGPDGQGQLYDPACGVGLGHRRLSIIDLSESGAQPMQSASGRYAITFNGEIYGFRALKRSLEDTGIRFRGTSDTEVLLEAIELYGVAGALERANGMFAFALLDRRERRLIFARDRLGKKPLYIGVKGNTLVFGSELKALRAHAAFYSPKIDTRALRLFLKYGYVPGPHTIFRGITKLPAGSWLSVPFDGPPPSIEDLRGAHAPFWSASRAAAEGHANRVEDEHEALAAIEDALLTATEERMVADVPVGTFLSGGIDSSLVTALMQEISSTPVRTYTVRFEEASINEADHAAEISRALGTAHHEFTATPATALALVDNVAHIFDEPFADPSQIPTMLISKLASEHLKVVLSGDGGDESFGGYRRYQDMRVFEALAQRVPPAALALADRAPLPVLEVAAQGASRVSPRFAARGITADRIKKLAEVLKHASYGRRYDAYMSLFSDPGALLVDPGDPLCPGFAECPDNALSSTEQAMLHDTRHYLCDDVLAKVDRASMAYGLEIRAPLLDYRVIEAAWRAPESLKLQNGVGKLALRQMLSKRLPAALYERPKQGFGVPINEWLRGPLRGFAEDLLSTESIAKTGVLEAGKATRLWQEHLSNRRNWGRQIWALLMFISWHRTWQ